MSEHSKIEWTDATWNPVRGCSKISPGCKNCYAERFAERFRGVPGHPFEQGFDVRLIPEKLSEPLRWKTPRKIFVNSMSDLFHESIPDSYILQVAEVMRKANWHIFQILTKRHERMAKLLSGPMKAFAAEPHIWWGVSVENRKHGLPRLRKLQKTPIAVRFLSIEPLLEDLGEVDLRGIAWVIVGGESGPGARLMHPDWVRSIQMDSYIIVGFRLEDRIYAGSWFMESLLRLKMRSVGPPAMTAQRSHPCFSQQSHGCLQK
jgi:protein gp37